VSVPERDPEDQRTVRWAQANSLLFASGKSELSLGGGGGVKIATHAVRMTATPVAKIAQSKLLDLKRGGLLFGVAAGALGPTMAERESSRLRVHPGDRALQPCCALW